MVEGLERRLIPSLLEAGISNFNEPKDHMGSSWVPPGISNSMFFIKIPNNSITGGLCATF